MNPVTGLAVGRIAIGVTALASPDRAARLFRLDAADNPQLQYMTRLFGSREIALGAITLLVKGSARRNLVALGMIVDGADAAAGYKSFRSGAVSQSVGISLTVPALAAVAAGAVGVAKER